MEDVSTRPGADPGWTDQRLVRACLGGDETAWHAIVDKYKNYVFAIVLKHGVVADEATDVFQTVWLDAYNDLPKLRRPGAFKPWLVSLTTHKCYHWRQQHRRRQHHETASVSGDLDEHLTVEPDLVDMLARDQLVREAVLALPARCREMIRLLFFTFPPKPYQEVAQSLGLATGSIGFIRRRCLQRLQKTLEKLGLH